MPTIREIHFTKLIGDPVFFAFGFVVGKVATVYCRWVNVGSFGVNAWGLTDLARMDVSSDSEGFTMFVDSMQGSKQQNRFLYVYGNKLCFRVTEDMNIPEKTWHIATVSFPIK